MITKLNQLTNIVMTNAYGRKTGQSSSRVASTSARAISALDGEFQVDPNKIYGDIIYADFDSMYNDIVDQHSENPGKPLTYGDGQDKFKVIVLPHGPHEYSITVAELKGGDPNITKASYTCITGSIIGKEDNEKGDENGIDSTEFKEIFYQMAELFGKNIPQKTRKERMNNMNAWIYDY